MQRYTVKEIGKILKEEEIESGILQLLAEDKRIGVIKLLEAYYKRCESRETEKKRLQKMMKYEIAARTSGYTVIAGVDEAGRGPLAGPVVAAAVILPLDVEFTGLNDSKKLSPQKRESLFAQIEREAVDLGVGIIQPAIIDELNIHQASLKAMRIALEALYLEPEFVLVDGFAIPHIKYPQKAMAKGDSLSLSIAAASVIAKVTRDRIMLELHRKYPEYGFAFHKGYGTVFHMAAIREHGLTPEHRRSFSHG